MDIEEWQGFGRKYILENHKVEEEKFQMRLKNCNNKKERDTISETSFDVIFNMLKMIRSVLLFFLIA